MKYFAIIVLSILFSPCAAAQLVTIEGQRYYRLSHASYQLGPTGRLSEAQAAEADRVSRSLRKSARENRDRGKSAADQEAALKSLWQNLHLVYSGKLYGYMMVEVFIAHLESTYDHFCRTSARNLRQSTVRGGTEEQTEGLVIREVWSHDVYAYWADVPTALFQYEPERLHERRTRLELNEIQESDILWKCEERIAQHFAENCDRLLDELFTRLPSSDPWRRNNVAKDFKRLATKTVEFYEHSFGYRRAGYFGNHLAQTLYKYIEGPKEQQEFRDAVNTLLHGRGWLYPRSVPCPICGGAIPLSGESKGKCKCGVKIERKSP